MSQKPLLFLLMLVVLLTACSPSAADMTPVSTSPAIIQSPPASVSSPTATAISATIPKHGDLIFIEFFAVTWVECKQMEPIVNGIKKQYASCIKVERVNFHDQTPWHDLLFPIGSPEFALLDSSRQILHRWFGYTDAQEFTELLDPLCAG